jgi:hypothetical protein
MIASVLALVKTAGLGGVPHLEGEGGCALMLRRMLLMATVGLVMAAMVALSALPALAVVVVPPHQHFLTPQTGKR